LGILKLPPELLQVHAMLRRFPLADENHGNVPAVAHLQDRIGINIDFSQRGAELLQERRDGGLGFVAQVASGPRIEGDVAGAGSGKTGIFGMSVHRVVAKLHLTGEQAALGRTAHNSKAIVGA
jgi:hypothetical protein